MTAYLLTALVLITLVLGGVIVWLLRNQSRKEDADAALRMGIDIQREITDLRGSLQGQVSELARQMQQQLEHNTQFLKQSHEGFNNTVGQVQHRLGQLQEATQSMLHIGKDISSLHDILKAPKLRGELGELFLGELLRQILPEDHFALQYTFSSGKKVDAIIRLGQGLIPVDAKFPIDNFKRLLQAGDDDSQKTARKSFIQDVKKHIDDIASKYILPEEGTFEFALMYIPAENVYYETIIKDEQQAESISSYAIRKKVIPVSPNSFYAYLQAIVRGLKGLRIERSALMILENLGQLETDFGKCFEDFEKIGSHLGNAQTSFTKAQRRFEKIHDRISSIEDVRKGHRAELPEDHLNPQPEQS